jgi:tetratricopeptide (TPR) repeat protein
LNATKYKSLLYFEEIFTTQKKIFFKKSSFKHCPEFGVHYTGQMGTLYFSFWHEGKEFYEKAFIKDFYNPYVLQQGALYLAKKYKYEEAFFWIDKAMSMTDNKQFTIRNSHAIILFKANINVAGNIESVRLQLDKSMSILEKCIEADRRKYFHAIIYSQQAIKYFYKFSDDKSIEYLKKSSNWLNKEKVRSKWNLEIPKLLDKVVKILSKSNPSN